MSVRVATVGTYTPPPLNAVVTETYTDIGMVANKWWYRFYENGQLRIYAGPPDFNDIQVENERFALEVNAGTWNDVSTFLSQSVEQVSGVHYRVTRVFDCMTITYDVYSDRIKSTVDVTIPSNGIYRLRVAYDGLKQQDYEIQTATSRLSLGYTYMEDFFTIDLDEIISVLGLPQILVEPTGYDVNLFFNLGVKTQNDSIFVDPVTIDTTSSTIVSQMGSQNNVAYRVGRYWALYYDGTNLVYTSSADGSSWDSPTTIRSSNDGRGMQVCWSGTNKVHYAYGDHAAGSPTACFYRRGTLGSNGVITWDAAEQTVDSYSSSYRKPARAVGIDSAGYAYVAVQWLGASSGSYGMVVHKNANTDGTWSSDWSDSSTFSANLTHAGAMFPDDAGEIMFIHIDGYQDADEHTLSSSGVSAKVADIVDESAAGPNRRQMGLTGDGSGTMYYTSSDEAASYRYLDIFIRESGSWGEEESSAVTINGDINTSWPCSWSPHGQKLYTFWMDEDDDKVKYIIWWSQTSGLSSETELVDESSGGLYDYAQIACSRAVESTGEIIVMYMSGSSSPYDVEVVLLDTLTDVSTDLKAGFEVQRSDSEDLLAGFDISSTTDDSEELKAEFYVTEELENWENGYIEYGTCLGSSGTTTDTDSRTITIPSTDKSGRIVLCFMSYEDATGYLTCTATSGSDPMKLLGYAQYPTTGSFFNRVAIFYLLDEDITSTGSVTVTGTWSASVSNVHIHALALQGVQQKRPNWAWDTGSGGTPSTCSITTVKDGVIISHISTGWLADFTANSGQTKLLETDSTSSSAGTFLERVSAGATTDSITYTGTFNRDVHAVVSLEAMEKGNTWGIDDKLVDTETNVNFCRAMGGTPPTVQNGIKITAVGLLLPSAGAADLRVGIYQGGALATSPVGADLLADCGARYGGTSGGDYYYWYLDEPVWANETDPIWIVVKGNDSGKVVCYSTSSGDAGDFQSARGRWNSASMSTDETAAFPSTWPTDGGSFGNFWYNFHLIYEDVGPPIDRWKDGVESNSFAAWTATQESSGDATLTVQGTVAKIGAYAMKAAQPTGAGNYQVWARYTITETDRIQVGMWVRYDEFPDNTYHHYVMQINDDSWNYLIRVGLQNSTGSYFLRVYNRANATGYNVYLPTQPSVDTWYWLEVELKVDDVEGYIRTWWDEQPIHDQPNIDTLFGAGDYIEHVYAGSFYPGTPEASNAYIDDVVIDDEYIGPTSQTIEDLLAGFDISSTTDDSEDLKAGFEVQHSDSEELKAEFSAQRSASQELLGVFEVQRSSSQELLASFWACVQSTKPLTDNFNDNVLNLCKWKETGNASSDCSEQNNRLELSSGSLIGLVGTKYQLPAHDSEILVKVFQVSDDCGFSICPTYHADANQGEWFQNDWYRFYMDGTNINAQVKESGGSPSIIATASSVSAPFWIRFRITRTTVYWDYAVQDVKPGGNSWTNLTSRTWGMSVGISSPIYLYNTVYNAAANGDAYYDDFEWNLLAYNDLPAKFEVRNDASKDLKAEFTSQQSGSQELLGVFEVQRSSSQDLLGYFEVQRSDSEELLAEFAVRRSYPGPGDTPLRVLGVFDVQQASSQELKAEFSAQRSASQELLGVFEVQRSDSEELLGEFISRQAGSQELLGEFIVKQETSVDLLAYFSVRRDSSQELLGYLDIRRSASQELLGEFITRQAGSAELLGEFIVKQASSQELLGYFKSQHSASQELKASFDGQVTRNLLAKFVTRHTNTQNLLSFFFTQHSITKWSNGVEEGDWSAWDIGLGISTNATVETGDYAIRGTYGARFYAQFQLGSWTNQTGYIKLVTPSRLVYAGSWMRIDEMYPPEVAGFHGLPIELAGANQEFARSNTVLGIQLIYKTSTTYTLRIRAIDGGTYLSPSYTTSSESSTTFNVGSKYWVVAYVDIKTDGTGVAKLYVDGKEECSLSNLDNDTARHGVRSFTWGINRNDADNYLDLVADDATYDDEYPYANIDRDEELLASFNVRHSSSADLLGSFEVQHSGSQDLKARFDGQVTLNLLGEFIARQPGSRELLAEFVVRQTGSAELLGVFEVRRDGSQELLGIFDIRRSSSQELLAYFTSRQAGSRGLKASFAVQQETSENLLGVFEIQRSSSRELPAEFVTRQTGSQNLLAEFIVRQETSQDLLAYFTVQHTGSQELLAEFISRQTGSQELLAEVVTRQSGSQDLLGEFTSRQAGSAELLAEFTVRHDGSQELLGYFETQSSASQELLAYFISQQPSSQDLLAYFDIQRSGFQELLAEFTVRYSSSQELLGIFTARQAGSAELLAEFAIRRDGSQELFAEFESGQGSRDLLAYFLSKSYEYEDLKGIFDVGQGSQELPAEFISRQAGSAELLGEFTVRQAGSAELLGCFETQRSASQELLAEFASRQDSSAELLAEFMIRLSASSNLKALYTVVHSSSAELLSEFIVRQTGSAELLGEFTVRRDGSQNLLGVFSVRRDGSQDLLAEFVTRQAGSAELLGEFTVRHESSQELFAEFESGQGSGDLLAYFESKLYEYEDLKSIFDVGQGSQELPAEFTARQTGSAELLAEFVVRQTGSAELLGEFIVRQTGSSELLAEFITRQATSQELLGYFTSRQTGSVELLGEFMIRLSTSSDLKALYTVVHSSSADLLAEFTSRQAGSTELLGEFAIRRDSSQDLLSVFSVRRDGSQDLLAEFITRQAGSAELLAEFIVRHETSQELFAYFEVGQGSRDLLAIFESKLYEYEDLKGIFEAGQGSQELHAEFTSRQAGSAELLGEFSVRQTGSQDLLGYFEAQRISSQELFAEFVIRRSSSEDLLAEFNSKQSGSQNLLAYFSIRRDNSRELLAYFETRHSSSQELLAEFITRQLTSQDLLAEFASRQTGSQELYAQFESGQGSRDLLAYFISELYRVEDLKAIFEVGQGSQELPAEFTSRHASSVEILCSFTARRDGSRDLFVKLDVGQGSEDLLAQFTVVSVINSTDLYGRFNVRTAYPLWTTRRYLNSILTITEFDVDDALLETVIMGVMNDVKSWLITQGLSYSAWTDITMVPKAIIRATTFGVAASLYARELYFPINRALIQLLPVEATVIISGEDAMDYWEDRMMDSLNKYYILYSSPILLAEDEDPVFTMDDIV